MLHDVIAIKNTANINQGLNQANKISILYFVKTFKVAKKGFCKERNNITKLIIVYLYVFKAIF